MIVIPIQLKSAIDSSRDQLLGTLLITNDGTLRDPNRGNYTVRMYGKNKRLIREAKVLNHSRKSLPIGTLVKKALEALKY